MQIEACVRRYVAEAYEAIGVCPLTLKTPLDHGVLRVNDRVLLCGVNRDRWLTF